MSTGLRLRQAGVLALAALLAGVMVVLGLWQAGVARNQGNQSMAERAAQPAVALPDSTSTMVLGQLYGRQVNCRGSYLPHQVLVGTQAPYRVVTAFRCQGFVLAVARGTVSSRSATVPPAPSGTLVQTGVLLPGEVASDAGTGTEPADLRSLRLDQLAQKWPAPLSPAFITLNADQAGAQGLAPAKVVLPEGQGHARNRGYALQWWVFASFALIMGVVIARSMGRRPEPE